jgi:hypothetical protein
VTPKERFMEWWEREGIDATPGGCGETDAETVWNAALDSLDVEAATHEARARGFDCPGTVEIRAILDAAKGMR